MAIDSRLLTVLEALNELGVCTVLDLHRATGLSRPAVHRMVQSLCASGYAQRLDGGSAIRPTARVLALSAGYRVENRVSAHAAPVLADVQAKLRWPLSFAMPEGDAIVIQETTRDRNPFVFDAGRVGLRLPMLSTALGCAYLAACGAAEREQVFDLWRASHAHDQSYDTILAAAHRRIEAATRKGYALRSGGAPKRTSSLAVPVVVFETPVGALCTTFPTASIDLDLACAEYPPVLVEAASAIAAACQARPGAR